MSLRSIDMHLAINKDVRAGQIQQQMQQKPLNDQNLLAGSQEKAAEHERHKSGQVSEAASASVHPDDSSGQKGEHSSDQRKRTKEPMNDRAPRDIEHPYKGRRIDIQG